jgi:hypothetical protein
MWIKDTLQLLGARFKGEGIGYGWFEYSMPNGDVISVDRHEQWRYLDDGGIGSESLWTLAYPRYHAWQTETKAKAEAECKARYSKVVTLLESITAHLNAIDWTGGDGVMVLHADQPTEAYPYPALSIKIPGGRAEVCVEIKSDGSILRASVGGNHCSGIPTIKKQALKYYNYQD